MAFLDPQNNIQQLNLTEGAVVADLGAGSGFYSIESAKIVGSSGRVYSIDVQKDLLDRIKNSARNERLFNIETIVGDVERIGGTKLADFSVDVVIAANILFQIDDKKNFLIEIKRIMKPNARVLVVDWSDSFNGLGPSQDLVFTEQQAMSLFEESGFVFNKSISAGDHHYGLIFNKK